MKRFHLIALLIIFVSACKKNTHQTSGFSPLIYSLSSSSGNPGTLITITGTGFSNVATNNTVTINGVVARVISSTSTSLTFSVPVSAGTGPIFITTVSGTVEGPTFTYLPDVFTSSMENNNVYQVAKVFKNAKLLFQTDSFHMVYSYSMAVSDTDVYITGTMSTSTTNSRAVYWKNGIMTALTDGSQKATASQILVVGKDIYVAGSEFNGSYFVAKYWKNGVPTSLTNGTSDAAANNISVIGKDVYVAGSENSLNGFSVAKLWKNGTATALTNLKSGYSNVSALAVSATDVYVGVYVFDSLGHSQFWHNGTLTDVQGGAQQIDNMAITPSNDFYMVGRQGITAMVWKNNVGSALTDGTSSAFAHGICFYGADVYITGAKYSNSNEVGLYWKNASPTIFDNSKLFETSWGIVAR